MSLHSFDPEVAKRVGINAAVIYQNILFWTKKNAANGRHIHDGYVWTYNSVKAMTVMFDYLSADQIRHAIQKLLTEGLIAEGNFNVSGYDRTKWYGVSSQIHLGKIPNRSGSNPEPIPDSKPDGNTDGKPISSLPAASKVGKSGYTQDELDQGFEAMWKLWPKRNGSKAGKKPAKQKFMVLAKSGADLKLIGDGVRRYAKLKGDDNPYAKDMVAWLNQEGWNDEIDSSAGSGTRRNAGAVFGEIARALRDGADLDDLGDGGGPGRDPKDVTPRDTGSGGHEDRQLSLPVPDR